MRRQCIPGLWVRVWGLRLFETFQTFSGIASCCKWRNAGQFEWASQRSTPSCSSLGTKAPDKRSRCWRLLRVLPCLSSMWYLLFPVRRQAVQLSQTLLFADHQSRFSPFTRSDLPRPNLSFRGGTNSLLLIHSSKLLPFLDTIQMCLLHYPNVPFRGLHCIIILTHILSTLSNATNTAPEINCNTITIIRTTKHSASIQIHLLLTMIS